RRSAVRSRESSARHPDFRILWKVWKEKRVPDTPEVPEPVVNIDDRVFPNGGVRCLPPSTLRLLRRAIFPAVRYVLHPRGGLGGRTNEKRSASESSICRQCPCRPVPHRKRAGAEVPGRSGHGQRRVRYEPSW